MTTIILIIINLEENNKGESRQHFEAELSDCNQFIYLNAIGNYERISVGAFGIPVAEYSDTGINGHIWTTEGAQDKDAAMLRHTMNEMLNSRIDEYTQRIQKIARLLPVKTTPNYEPVPKS